MVRTDTLVKLATLVPALVLAENFYKFHSFTVEFAAFAATWAAFYGVARLFTRRSA